MNGTTAAGSAGVQAGLDRSPKERLLDAVIDHFTTDGLADQSLRRIAEAIGSSHRMLLYHFGSKDGLLLEVVREVEARTQERLARVAEDAGMRSDVVIRRMWSYLTDPELAGFERLFFALYGRALQGDQAALPLLRDDIEHWLEANVALAAEVGVLAEQVRAHSRLGLAVMRGLLLDLLATGDRAGVDAALEAFADGYAGRWWGAGPDDAGV
ncbi:MAG TPA: TetR/AcrR family transcriptional regulator [Acidimicrobiales bacterium]|jgi:AcrR family transcriptional regulator|nr:TetR/AcrR family transcriptional regulator [Acidimicrobiales bacterium]